ncbi:MAG: LacI family DNA-binding transcriptional regulator [Lachnospiraceae bacterium]|nr:LacI family DNA-binding transcriptional regulator [Lachnospiraceae bacterium]
MATIKEIATLAGVSRGTVDRVLNHRGDVNPQTEEKILQIIRDLDYRPNKAGIVLAAQKKNLKLGVVLLGVGNPFFDDVLSGVHEKEQELAGYNCSILVRQTEYSLQQQLDAIDSLLSEGIDGLAISPYNDRAVRDKINSLSEQGIPVVTLNTDIENSSRLAYVGSNFYRSGEAAGGLMHLMTRGEVRVGIVSGSRDILCHTERIAGFSHIIASYPNIRIVDTVNNNDDDQVSCELTKKLLADHPEINAFYFTAGGVYGGCQAIEASACKNDMTVITNDMVPTTREYMQKGLIAATICQQPLQQGSQPLSLLFTYLTTGETPAAENNYVDVEIRIRENL